MGSNKTTFQKFLAFFGLATQAELESLNRAFDNQSQEVTRLSKEIDKLEDENDRLTAKNAQEAQKSPKESKMKLSYKVGYIEAKRRLKKRSLAQLRAALEAVPNNAGGFGGTAIVYRDKKVEAINFKSKNEALQLVKDAEEGKLHLVF